MINYKIASGVGVNDSISKINNRVCSWGGVISIVVEVKHVKMLPREWVYTKREEVQALSPEEHQG